MVDAYLNNCIPLSKNNSGFNQFSTCTNIIRNICLRRESSLNIGSGRRHVGLVRGLGVRKSRGWLWCLTPVSKPLQIFRTLCCSWTRNRSLPSFQTVVNICRFPFGIFAFLLELFVQIPKVFNHIEKNASSVERFYDVPIKKLAIVQMINILTRQYVLLTY